LPKSRRRLSRSGRAGGGRRSRRRLTCPTNHRRRRVPSNGARRGFAFASTALRAGAQRRPPRHRQDARAAVNNVAEPYWLSLPKADLRRWLQARPTISRAMHRARARDARRTGVAQCSGPGHTPTSVPLIATEPPNRGSRWPTPIRSPEVPSPMSIDASAAHSSGTIARCRRCHKPIIWPGLCYTCATGLPRQLRRHAEALDGEPAEAAEHADQPGGPA
jgi:hypothetical protein